MFRDESLGNSGDLTNSNSDELVPVHSTTTSTMVPQSETEEETKTQPTTTSTTTSTTVSETEEETKTQPTTTSTTTSTTVSETEEETKTQPTTNRRSLHQMLIRQHDEPTLREITENIFRSNWASEMENKGYHGQFKKKQDGLRDGIINVMIPNPVENPEFAGVRDIHIHIFPTRYDGTGIRIGFENNWRLDYESGDGQGGVIFIRSPDGRQHPRLGLSDSLSFPNLMIEIRQTLNGLNRYNQVPNDLLNISDSNLRDLIEYILFYLLTQVQQHRIRGGKKKTYRKYKHKKIKTRRKNKKKTKKKNIKKYKKNKHTRSKKTNKK